MNSNTTALRCPKCKNVVAVREGSGEWVIRHSRRVIGCGEITRATCEDCGHSWRVSPEPEYNRLATSTVRRVA